MQAKRQFVALVAVFCFASAVRGEDVFVAMPQGDRLKIVVPEGRQHQVNPAESGRHAAFFFSNSKVRARWLIYPDPDGKLSTPESINEYFKLDITGRTTHQFASQNGRG